MGPELVAAILGPIFGGGMTLLIYFGKKNTDRIDRGFLNLTNGLQSIERTVQELSLDVVKNYVSHDEMRAHEAQESIWHQHMEGEFNGLRNEVQDYKRIAHVLINYFIRLNFIPKVEGLQFLRSLHLVQFEG